MEQRIDRRTFLTRSAAGAVLLAGGGSLLAACGADEGTSASGGGAGSFEALSVQMNWILNAEFAGSYIASEKGYYEREGFPEVSLLAGGPTVAVEPVVTSGRALYAYSVSEFVAGAVLEGAPLKVLGACFPKNPFCIMSLAETPITKPEDMIGKTIGVQAVNESIWNALLEINQIDPGEINKIPVQFDPTPLVNGEADGWFSFVTNEPNVLRAEGHEVAVMLLADFGFELYQQLLIATQDSFDNRRDELIGGLRAESKGWQYNITDPELGARLAVEEFGRDLGLAIEGVLAENKDQIELIVSPVTDKKGLFYMGEEDLTKSLETLTVLGLEIPEEVFTNELLDEIYADGIDLI